MQKILVYDIPTRIFHGLMAGLFVAAYGIAQVFDDDSSLYPYHMMIGFTLAGAVVLRVLWGVIGSRYARFSSFELNPSALVNYLKDAVTAKTKIFAGHNPASSWAAILMMAISLGLALTGFQMTQGDNKEFYHEAHELLANGFMFVVVFHILGVIFHTIRHKDPIGLSMISGKKLVTVDAQAIPSSQLVPGIIFLALVVFFATPIFNSYNSANKTFVVFGKTLSVGENENEGASEGGTESHDGDGHEGTRDSDGDRD
jgi:cytochrome b